MNNSEKIYRVNDQGMIVEEIDELDDNEFNKVNPQGNSEHVIFDNMMTAH